MTNATAKQWGSLSIACCGLSIVVPLLTYGLGRVWTQTPTYQLEQGCGWIFLGFLITAMLSGIVGWRQRTAKIGFGIACGIFLSIVVFSAIPMSMSEPERLQPAATTPDTLQPSIELEQPSRVDEQLP